MSGVLQTVKQAFTGTSPAASQGYGTIPQTDAGAPPPGATKPAPGSKIEPKVFLAAERTLIAWLRTSLLMGTFAIALYNATATASAANTMGIVYAIISVAAIFYAWAVYQQRCRRIATKWPGHFDELYGPGIYSVLIFSAVLVNFILRVHNRETVTKPPKSPFLAAALSAFVDVAPSAPRLDV